MLAIGPFLAAALPGHPAEFIVDAVELQWDEYLFQPGLIGANLFQGTPITTVLVLRLSFA